jgi:hypothetical protein
VLTMIMLLLDILGQGWVCRVCIPSAARVGVA